jgi:hypothetical protein
MRRTLRVVHPSEEPVHLAREEEEPTPVNPRPHDLAIQELVVYAGSRIVKKLFPIPGGFREERGS